MCVTTRERGVCVGCYSRTMVLVVHDGDKTDKFSCSMHLLQCIVITHFAVNVHKKTSSSRDGQELSAGSLMFTLSLI